MALASAVPEISLFAIHVLAFTMINLVSTKFKVSNSTHYVHTKVDAKYQNGFFVVRGSLKVTGNSTIRYSAYKFLFAFHSNCSFRAPFLRCT